MDRKNERGGMLIYIFIFAGMFAALSYAVTQSFRTGDMRGMTEEKMSLYTTSIMEYSEALRTQVALMIKVNKVPDSQLDFANDVNLREDGTVNCNNDNTTCASNDATCAVFQPQNPEGIQPKIFPEVATNRPGTSSYRTKNGHGIILHAQIAGQGTSAEDLVYYIRGIDPDFCNFYNKKLGITTNFTDATTFASIGENDATVSQYYDGCNQAGNSWGPATALFGDEPDSRKFVGHKTFCAPYDFSWEQNPLAIYNILLAR